MHWTRPIAIAILALVLSACVLIGLHSPWPLAAGVLILQGFLTWRLLVTAMRKRFDDLKQHVEHIQQERYDIRLSMGTESSYSSLAEALNHLGDAMESRVAAMGQEQSELAAILRGLQDGVVAIDTDERIRRFNRAGAVMLAFPDDQAKGRSLWEFTRAQPLIDCARDVLRHAEPRATAARVFHGDDERLIQATAAPLIDPDGTLEGAVLLLRDTTDLSRLEGARREFFANASHELKTPIASICAASETLLDGDDMAPDIRERFTRSVMANGKRLQSLVEEMIDLARIESATTRSDGPEHCNVHTMVAMAMEGVEPLAHEKHVRIAFHEAPDAPRVVAPRESVFRIVSNLLNNAVKYSPKGARIDAGVSHDAGRVQFYVKDRGPGIPPSKRQRIFERFYRLDAGRGREHGGTGLGLAIVKHLAQSCGAEVTVDEHEEPGSVFQVAFVAAPHGPRERAHTNYEN